MKPQGIRKYWLFSKAVVTVHLIRGSLRWLGFSRTLDLLESCMPDETEAADPGPEVLAHPMVWAVRAAARRTLKDRPCLPSALAVLLFLRRAGIPAELKIGVERPEKATLSAHAWVASGERVLLGGSISPERYRPFSALRMGPRSTSSE